MPSQPITVPVQPGEVVAGKYRVDHVLGAGGMGVVVAATHLQLQQRVAIKFTHALLGMTTGGSQRFLREARASAKLRSEHVAKVVDFGELGDGTLYMVMEYLEGRDLAEFLAQNGPLAVEQACDYVLQACIGLAEAHSHGIVHRDLKPQNLFLCTDVGGEPLVKVLDFGISKVPTESEGNLTQTAAILGSPRYMSPEQVRSSRDVDVRTDIWAMGVVLYELLSGSPPFVAGSAMELCVKVLEDEPAPLDTLRPVVPPRFASIVHRCLNKDAQMRFATVADLASALGPFGGARGSVNAGRVRSALLGPGHHASGGNDADAIATTSLEAVSRTGAGLPTPMRRGPILLGLSLAVGGGTIAGVLALGAGERPPAVSGAPAASPVVSTTRLDSAASSAAAARAATPATATSEPASMTPDASTTRVDLQASSAARVPPPQASLRAPSPKPALSGSPPPATTIDDGIPRTRKP
jgi:hypothetical protein